MRRHGYKGAFEMAATVDYLFGYDATAGVMADWMYERLTAGVRARRREPQVHGRVQPVGAARHGRAAARGRRPRHVGASRTPPRSTGCARCCWRPRATSRAESRYFEAMAPTFAEVAEAKYLLLTTFTKDGRPKPTPIWAAPDGDRLLVITEEESWKVKRIRNTPGSPSRCAMRAATARVSRSRRWPDSRQVRSRRVVRRRRQALRVARLVVRPLFASCAAGRRRTSESSSRPRSRLRNPAALRSVGRAWLCGCS